MGKTAKYWTDEIVEKNIVVHNNVKLLMTMSIMKATMTLIMMSTSMILIMTIMMMKRRPELKTSVLNLVMIEQWTKILTSMTRGIIAREI